jgi:hypothetical protein
MPPFFPPWMFMPYQQGQAQGQGQAPGQAPGQPQGQAQGQGQAQAQYPMPFYPMPQMNMSQPQGYGQSQSQSQVQQGPGQQSYHPGFHAQYPPYQGQTSYPPPMSFSTEQVQHSTSPQGRTTDHYSTARGSESDKKYYTSKQSQPGPQPRYGREAPAEPPQRGFRPFSPKDQSYQERSQEYYSPPSERYGYQYGGEPLGDRNRF